MSADPYAAQQELYELRNQLDRALTRIDELSDEARQYRESWKSLYTAHIKLVNHVGAIEASKVIQSE